MQTKSSIPDIDTLCDSEGGSLEFCEDSDPYDSFIYKLKGVSYNGRTAYQHVLIGDTYNYGRALVLDGDIQSAADDEGLYHEALVQPVMLRHENPQDVLIIGGGEGATLREVLAHKSVKSATMVDLDQEIVELCQKYLPSWHRGAFDDPRANLVFGDGRKFIEQTKNKYDVVIIDVVDSFDNGPAQALYTRQFYQHLAKILKPKALVAIQALEFSFLDNFPHATLARTLRTALPKVYSYKASIPSFLGCWGFVIASDWFDINDWSAAEIDKSIESKLGSNWLTHMTGEYLKSCFVMCKETQAFLDSSGPIMEDGVDFVPNIMRPNTQSKNKLPALD